MRPKGIALTIVGLAAAVASACGHAADPTEHENPGSEPRLPAPDDPHDVDRERLGRDPDAEAIGGARRIDRLTAEQFQATLEVATGQSYDAFEANAAAMGRPDYLESTEESTEPSVAFEKLAEDAARETCQKAIEADVAGTSPDPDGPVLLRHAGASDSDRNDLARNLQYLLLRFHAVHAPEPTDERLQPWLELLEAEGEAEMPSRWAAVCVGLATHPDFVTF